MRFVFFILCALALSGCATWPRQAVKLSSSERAAFVTDSTQLLSAQFLPAKTTIHIACEPNDLLATELQASLRERGFAVLSEKSAESKTASIIIIPVGTDAYLLRLNVSSDWAADRLYRREPTGISAETGFTVRNDGDPQNG